MQELKPEIWNAIQADPAAFAEARVAGALKKAHDALDQENPEYALIASKPKIYPSGGISLIVAVWSADVNTSKPVSHLANVAFDALDAPIGLRIFVSTPRRNSKPIQQSHGLDMKEISYNGVEEAIRQGLVNRDRQFVWAKLQPQTSPKPREKQHRERRPLGLHRFRILAFR